MSLHSRFEWNAMRRHAILMGMEIEAVQKRLLSGKRGAGEDGKGGGDLVDLSIR